MFSIDDSRLVGGFILLAMMIFAIRVIAAI